MKDREPPVADPSLLARLRFDPSRDTAGRAKARVRSRLQASIAAMGTAGAASGPSPQARDVSSGVAPLSPRPLEQPTASSLGWLARFAAKPLGVVATAFFVGGVGGAGMYAAMSPPRERTVYLDRPVAVPEPRPFVIGTPGVARATREPALAEEEGSAARARKTKGTSPTGVSDLAAERELLDRARKALARGDAADAQQALELHARRHAFGRLVEEREALAIKVLFDLGRTEDGRRRAAKFKEHFPRSLFGPSVDEALGTME